LQNHASSQFLMSNGSSSNSIHSILNCLQNTNCMVTSNELNSNSTLANINSSSALGNMNSSLGSSTLNTSQNLHASASSLVNGLILNSMSNGSMNFGHKEFLDYSQQQQQQQQQQQHQQQQQQQQRSRFPANLGSITPNRPLSANLTNSTDPNQCASTTHNTSNGNVLVRLSNNEQHRDVSGNGNLSVNGNESVVNVVINSHTTNNSSDDCATILISDAGASSLNGAASILWNRKFDTASIVKGDRGLNFEKYMCTGITEQST